MLRLTNNFKNLQICNANANLQFIRWKRKPISLPTAKTKVFRVPKRPQIPEEESEEIKRLFNNYRTQMKSIRKYLWEKYGIERQQTADLALHKKNIAEDFIRCQSLNDAWNEEVKIQREAFYNEQLDKDKAIASERLQYREKINQLKLQEAENIVREQKEQSKYFITKENLDEAIDKAMASEVDHNFALTKDGEKILGRNSKPDEKISIKQ